MRHLVLVLLASVCRIATAETVQVKYHGPVPLDSFAQSLFVGSGAATLRLRYDTNDTLHEADNIGLFGFASSSGSATVTVIYHYVSPGSVAAISGRITLEGCVQPMQPVTLTLRPTGGCSEIIRTVTLAADGLVVTEIDAHSPEELSDYLVKEVDVAKLTLSVTRAGKAAGKDFRQDFLGLLLDPDVQVHIEDEARAAMDLKPGMRVSLSIEVSGGRLMVHKIQARK